MKPGSRTTRSVMSKSVSDFIPESIDVDCPVLFVGISPSSKTIPFKNGTFAKLKHWANEAGLEKFDFCNAIPDVINSMSMDDVDFDSLIVKCKGKSKVVALGGFVSRVLKRCGIPHLKIDHPSPRNRNLNSPEYEVCLINNLKAFVND